MKAGTTNDRLSDIAYSRLRYEILEGQLQPGTRLVEREVGRALQMGRSPVREALVRLAGEGLIESIPNAGFSVKHITLEDIEEAYQIRAGLECLAIRLACQRGFTDAKLVQLDHCCDLLDRAVARDDQQAVGKADFEFHQQHLTVAMQRRLKLLLQRRQPGTLSRDFVSVGELGQPLAKSSRVRVERTS